MNTSEWDYNDDSSPQIGDKVIDVSTTEENQISHIIQVITTHEVVTTKHKNPVRIMATNVGLSKHYKSIGKWMVYVY